MAEKFLRFREAKELEVGKFITQINEFGPDGIGGTYTRWRIKEIKDDMIVLELGSRIWKLTKEIYSRWYWFEG